MTEIFATLGPACAQADILEKMFLEGMTGMRLNLSHTSLRQSGRMLHDFQLAAQRAGVQPELLIDMQGPEVRIGELHAPLQLKKSQEVIFTVPNNMQPRTDMIPAEPQVLSVLEPGDHVLLDDGKIELVVTSVKPAVTARVLRAGTLQNKKSLKVQGKQICGPVLTDQDMENIRMAKDYGVTALMQPFVTKGSQLLEVKQALHKNGLKHIRIFAKIENREGIHQIQDILPAADMVVIARGDLGNDMPLWKLPAAQKTISEACKKEGKPFLVVTQLLASMADHPYPTRAEVSDIFHAVADGASAVMVTNETAVGKYPVEVIRYLKKTACEAESSANLIKK